MTLSSMRVFSWPCVYFSFTARLARLPAEAEGDVVMWPGFVPILGKCRGIFLPQQSGGFQFIHRHEAVTTAFFADVHQAVSECQKPLWVAGIGWVHGNANGAADPDKPVGEGTSIRNFSTIRWAAATAVSRVSSGSPNSRKANSSPPSRATKSVLRSSVCS